MRHAGLIVAPLLAASVAQADPPRTLAMPDLSPTRVAGVELTVGGFDRRYSALTAARLDLFGDVALGPAAKVTARLLLGYERTVVDEGDDIAGPWLGNLVLGGRWIPWRPAGLQGFELGVGGDLVLPVGSADEEGDPGVTTSAYHFTHAPRWIDPTFLAAQVGADLRYRWARAFAQVDAALMVVYDDGPQVDAVRVAAGGGAWVLPRLALSAELTIARLPAADVPPDGDLWIALDLGVVWRAGRASFALRYYLPIEPDIDGSYGAVGVRAEVTF